MSGEHRVVRWKDKCLEGAGVPAGAVERCCVWWLRNTGERPIGEMRNELVCEEL